jgi:uncharacterized protein
MSQVLLSVAAIALISVASAQFASSGFTVTRTWRRFSRHRSLALRNLRNAAEIARLDSELQSAGSNPSNLDWRVMEVAEIVDESADCRSFYLVDPYRQSLPEFRPGQYLMVRPAIAGAFQTTRCYSLSSSPDNRYWRITVKRQEIQEGTKPTKNGGLSIWLHENIKSGDCLLIGGPSGHFFLPQDSCEPLVLLAAGVGITPMASMLRWSMEHTPSRPVTLLYQAKDLDHWPLGRSLHTWLQGFPNCQVISFFSRNTSEEINEQVCELFGEFRTGKFSAEDALQALPLDNCNYYVCGPDSWMASLRDGLAHAGVSESLIHWESFGGNPTASNTATMDSETCFTVSFENSDVEVQWIDPDQTLWELAQGNDVNIQSGCLSGVCGSCRVRVLCGEVGYDRKISIELANDECLSCIAHPLSDLRIEA